MEVDFLYKKTLSSELNNSCSNKSGLRAIEILSEDEFLPSLNII
ncbi:hypothetical protein T09_4984 [Trichinella sp. T9]|nr:hypothetical protein T09_4984 [Trichinella sp. T9]